jgi:hypothetical protein
MGASWLCLIIMLWFFLFRPMSKFLCVSRNADAVDDTNDSDSLFWKLDYIVQHLPEWATPNMTRRVMALANNDNGSQITGQASTGKAGVGGRALAIFVDEYSQIREDWEVLERTSDTSGCRIFNGTHKGTNTAFFDLCTKAKHSPNLIRKLVLHWSQHPDKNGGLYHYDRETNRVVYHDPEYEYDHDFTPVTDGSPAGGPFPGLRSPWYDYAAGRKGSARGVAADLDINPTGAIEQVFDALMIKDRQARYARPPVRYELEYDRETAEARGLHKKADGPIEVWCRIDKDGKPPRASYAFGADIAQGTGASPSCLSVANAETGEKVLQFTSAAVEPKEFAYITVALLRWLHFDGLLTRIAWEVPGPGMTYGKHIMLLGWRDVYFRTSEHRLKREVSDSPGWNNQPDSMLNLMLSYRDAIRSSQFLNRSWEALEECLSFIYAPDGYVYHTGAKSPKDASAARVNHGDRVIADALAWKMVDEMGRRAPVQHGESRSTMEIVAEKMNQLAFRKLLANMQNESTGIAD